MSKSCVTLPFPWEPKKRWHRLSAYFIWKPQHAGTSCTYTPCTMVCKNRPSSMLATQKAVCPALHIPKLHAIFGDSSFSVCRGHRNSQKASIGSLTLVHNLVPEGTTAKKTIPPYPRGEQPAKSHTPKTLPEVRTCRMGKDVS